MNSEKLLDEKADFNGWNGLDRRKTCQGCSSVYSKLLKSEKLNLSTHKELYELYQKKLSKRDFVIAIIIIAFLFTLSFKFRNDFELRYINSLEVANKKIQEVIYNLKDLILSIDSINKKISYSETDMEAKIQRIQKSLDESKKTLDNLKKQAERDRKK